jgi:tRNA dimethylallyltransferase
VQLNEQINTLISVVGPTAVGKTEKAIEIAEMLRTEIVSADSRQFYGEMTIGTAKPSKKDMGRVPHHFIDSHGIEEFYSAGGFERDALSLLDQLFRTYQKVVCVGGSGLYLKALWQGFDEMPHVNEGVREQLNTEFIETGLEPLLIELKIADSIYFEQVDQMNHQRVIRALEVIRSTGKPFSNYRQSEATVPRPFKNVKIGLEMDREKLNERIDNRMDQMISAGLFEEAELLYPHRGMNALQTVGYKEIFDFMEGKYDKEEAIRLLKRNSRRYAKRQMTWFRADPEIAWFDAGTTVEEILVSLHLA